MNPTVVRFDHADPNFRLIRDVAQQARSGKIVAFPTETVYGIGAPASRTEAVDRLYTLKGRDKTKPFAYHIGDWDQLIHLKVIRTPAFRYLSKKFWPGPVTLIVQTERGEKVGIRFPRNLCAITLIVSSGEPFVATSANLSGEPSPRTAEEVMKNLGSKIDYLIDAGPCELGKDSTVVDTTPPVPALLREGTEAGSVRAAIEEVQGGKIPRKKIEIICTGNSCRSPMAWGLLLNELRRKHLDQEIEVTTSGILARDGGMATPEAVFVMKNREIDISGHRSRSCRREELLDADLVLAMAKEHYDFLVGLVPGIKDKIKVLDVKDPIGQGIPMYEDAVNDIEKKLKREWDLIVK